MHPGCQGEAWVTNVITSLESHSLNLAWSLTSYENISVECLHLDWDKKEEEFKGEGGGMRGMGH